MFSGLPFDVVPDAARSKEGRTTVGEARRDGAELPSLPHVEVLPLLVLGRTRTPSDLTEIDHRSHLTRLLFRDTLINPRCRAPVAPALTQPPRRSPPPPSGTTALPTTSLSIHPPNFNMNAPPLRRNPTSPTTNSHPLLAPSLATNQSYSGASTPSHLSISSTLESTSLSPASSSTPRPPSPNTHPKGHLTIKLMSARGLNIPSEAMATSRPYVVVTFENNEFVSREPIESHEPTTKGVATYTPSAPPTPSSGILGIGSISRAFDMAARSRSAAVMGKTKLTLPGQKSGATTPKAAESRGEWLGKPSTCDPVWKHEVTL